jgi:hypothetical protein
LAEFVIVSQFELAQQMDNFPRWFSDVYGADAGAWNKSRCWQWQETESNGLQSLFRNCIKIEKGAKFRPFLSFIDFNIKLF